MLRRIIASSCIAVLAHLSFPTARASVPDDDWTRCEATPECVLWFDALALNAWYAALIHNHPFLVCTRDIESNGNYSIVSSNGKWFGGYQFELETWDSAASRHRPWLVGINPATASVEDQDALALDLYGERGNQPWGGRC